MDLRYASSIARKLMHQHGLTDWQFKFDGAKRRNGCCNHSKKIISLSRHYVRLNSEELVTDTILHEIAHALTPGAKHGPEWKSMCAEIGARPQRCKTNVASTRPNYVAICAHCGLAHTAYRLGKNMRQGKLYCNCLPIRTAMRISKPLVWKKV